MTILEMLGQSGIVTLLGMGIVLGFLTILVVVISQIGKFMISLDEKTTVPASQTSTITTAKPNSSDDSAQVTAAISAAINEYRKINKP